MLRLLTSEIGQQRTPFSQNLFASDGLHLAGRDARDAAMDFFEVGAFDLRCNRLGGTGDEPVRQVGPGLRRQR